MRFALLVSSLTLALVGCTPGLDDQVEAVSSDVTTLQQENAVLQTENAALTRALDDLEAQIADLADDLGAQIADLADELDALGDENAALTQALDDLEAQIADLTGGGEGVDAVAAPVVRVGSERTNGAHTVAVEGDEITRWELVGTDGVSYPYDPVVWAEPTTTCHSFVYTGYLTITVWVWQGDAMTCHGAAEGCYPLVVTALDELPC